MAVAEKNRLKKWIYQTNDPDLLVTYYDRTEGTRNDMETDILEKRIASAYALDSMVSYMEAERDTMILDAQVFGVHRAGNRTELVGVLPDTEEDSYRDDMMANGWHYLFRSRGVEITSEDLRVFAGEHYPLYVMGELVERVIPKTGIRSVRLTSYDNASEEDQRTWDRTGYDAHLADVIRETVQEAVTKWRSPVLISMGNIALTVVGVNEDALLYVDEGFLGMESTLAEIDPETLLSDEENYSGNITLVYMTDREANE